jgi:predicted NBD/HSP70 family sugar kinase
MYEISKGVSQRDVQKHNERLILKIIHEKTECSRKIISDETGLDQGTVTRCVSRLITKGVVDEVSLLKNKRGRRSIGVSLTKHNFKVISIRLQRKNFSIALFDLLGNILEYNDYSINNEDESEKIFRNILTFSSPLIDQNKDSLLGIGIAVPGPFKNDSEKIILMTETKWNNFDCLKKFRNYYKNISIFSIQDANAAALSIWKDYYNPKMSIMLYISVGQGIGSAIVINGQLFEGSHGLAGEIGHTSIDINGPVCKCGNRGCLELYASSFVLLRKVQNVLKEHGVNNNISLKQISILYKNNDELIINEINKIIKYLAQGITNYVNLINPDYIIIGDEYECFGDKFIEQFKFELEKLLLPSIFQDLTITLAQSDRDLVLHGAFLNVLNKSLFKM